MFLDAIAHLDYNSVQVRVCGFLNIAQKTIVIWRTFPKSFVTVDRNHHPATPEPNTVNIYPPLFANPMIGV
jgi:hypothetical protein